MKKMTAALFTSAMAFCLCVNGGVLAGAAEESQGTAEEASVVQSEEESEWELLATITDYRDYVAEDDERGEFDLVYQVSLLSPEFSQYFKDGDNAAGLASIIENGEVWVNGYQIPYILEDGSYSTTDMVVNGQSNIWQVDEENDLWGWQLHMYYQYDGGPMGDLSGIEDYESGVPVSYETAVTYYVQYLSNIYGQPTYLYARKGEDWCSRIETNRLNTSIVSAVIDNGDGTVTMNATDGSELMTFDKENVDENIGAGDGIIYYELNGTGYVAQRAYEFNGPLVENPDDYHSPWILVDGENLSTGDTLSDKNIAEGYRHTQFIRGYRRTRLFDTDAPVSMWCTLPEGYSFGFTYANDSVRDDLEYAVNYTKEFAETLVTSEDGTDVPSDQMWVLPADMEVFQAALADAENLLAENEGNDDILVSFQYSDMILTLADAFGGTEGNFGPGANNTVGIFGSAQYGTK